MELLDPALKELESAETIFGSLDNHYVAKVYPQFKDDFKTLGIADIDTYENYNLQNVFDDLKHIQVLLTGSPKKDQFKKKVEFLVQLSHKTIKKVKHPPKESKESREPEEAKPIKLHPPQIKNIIKDQKEQVIPIPIIKTPGKKEKQHHLELPPLVVKGQELQVQETKKKDEIIKLKQVTVKEAPKEKKEIKKRRIGFGGLTKIPEEETIADNLSDIASPKRFDEPELNWNLTNDQKEMIQNTLIKYEMSEDVWKNYILTRVHGDAQLKRMGLMIPATKVDPRIETLKFVEEIERHMSRKARMTARAVNSLSLKPLEADAVTNPPNLKHFDILMSLPTEGFITPKTGKNRTLSSLDFNSVAFPLSDQQLSKKILPSTTMAASFLNKEDSQVVDNPKILSNMPTNLPLGLPLQRDPLKAKTWSLNSSHVSLTLPSQSHFDKFENKEHNNTFTGGQIDLNDSLRESLTMDQASMCKYIKSQGQYRLPSMTSSNSNFKRFSNLDSITSHGRRYKKSQKESQTECSLADSLDIDSLVLKNDYRKPFRISSVGTIRSKYFSSIDDIENVSSSKPASSQNLINIEGAKEDESQELRSDLTSERSSFASESLNERSTIKSTSIKTITTVCSQESGLSRTMSQVMRGLGIPDTEYCGKVKRLCLLGSGSEAKVFLCKVKEFEQEVALKQYDLVKNQKGNKDAYEALSKEFVMLKQLQNDNIIQYHCLYKPQKTAYHNCLEFGIIMEYMPGGSLDSYIEEGMDKLSINQKKSIMKQILSGLEYLHKYNIIHRDLKPGNILLSTDKTSVKISDFGISKQTNSDTNTRRTLVGTPWYMAPEVINQEGYSSKADIWSAGCCFFHLITGEKPYHNANAIQALLLMVNHKSPLEACDPPTLAKINESPGVREFLEHCFNRNQSERASASQLLTHPIFNGL
jgi:hypothetical protein